MNQITKKILLALVIVLFFAFPISAQEKSLDEIIFDFINQDLHISSLDQPMLLITHSGDGLTQGLVAGGFYLAGEKDTATLITSALLKTWWTTNIAKSIVQRPRPGATLGDVNFVGDYKITDHRSFPSGHTTGAFAVATVLSHQYPKYTPYFYTYSSLVGISRIYTGVHYPSDVLVGAYLGILIGQSTIKHKNLIITGNFIEYSIKF
ncbi:MAG: phosphatase PAP2 family protein [Halanaerobiales bacterium]|nr:phosphatase PAP2 family protein [Halanaerobiales bacterium]